MLSRGDFLLLPYPSAAPVINKAPHSSISCLKIHGGHFSPIFVQRPRFLPRDAPRYDFSVSSSKNGNDVGLLEMEGFLGEDDEWEEEDDDDDDVVDDEIDIPLMNMKNWHKNKPSGFGEGKIYDTSIEDKLFDEMEQSRLAQLANKNKLKSEASNPKAQKVVALKQKAKEEETPIQTGIPVRLLNLPKKKNIHRDLQLAFKGVPGILNIVPAVSANKKTRDPICKGFAFVYLHSETHAKKFVQLFSEQVISFGKIQKKIALEIVNPNTPQSKDYTKKLSSNASQSSSSKGVVGVDFQSDEEEEELEAFDEPETTQKTATASRKSQEPKPAASPKKPMAKKRAQKQQALTIPGSANRLKFKEKAVLTGVFSKYGSAPASVKQS